MRLGILDYGQAPAQRAALRLMRAAGMQGLDVVKTFMYRPQFFGMRFCDVTQEVMRGPSEWGRAEREMFGAYVSTLNGRLF